MRRANLEREEQRVRKIIEEKGEEPKPDDSTKRRRSRWDETPADEPTEKKRSRWDQTPVDGPSKPTRIRYMSDEELNALLPSEGYTLSLIHISEPTRPY